MIFYFSGTGNSEWVAKQLALGTNDTAFSIAELLKNNQTDINIKNEKQIGFVFPVYAWRAPKLVTDYAKKIKAETSVYRFAVCTCGDAAGLTMKIFAKKIHIDGAWSIVMPDNYIKMFDVEPENVAIKKIAEAEILLASVCKSVNGREKVWNVKKGSFPFIKSIIINPLFCKFTNTAKGFYSEDSCISCGLCEKVCPVENIKMNNGRPVWSDNCTQCLACIHRCPVQAIQYGKSTKNKGRYYFEKLTKK